MRRVPLTPPSPRKRDEASGGTCPPINYPLGTLANALSITSPIGCQA